MVIIERVNRAHTEQNIGEGFRRPFERLVFFSCSYFSQLLFTSLSFPESRFKFLRAKFLPPNAKRGEEASKMFISTTGRTTTTAEMIANNKQAFYGVLGWWWWWWRYSWVYPKTHVGRRLLVEIKSGMKT